MIDRRAAALLLKQLLYIGIGLLIIFYQLLPLKTTPPTWVGPNLLMAITIVYAVRRPAYIPIVSVALLFLFSDFILQRPPGLMSLFMVIGCEWLKRRSHHLRVATFGVEWLAVAIVIILQAIGSHLLLTLTMAPPPLVGLTAMQTIGTIMLYPVLARAAHHLLGIHKSPTDGDNLVRYRL